MNDVRLDPQQVPSRAELLLTAELGEDAPGRPIFTRPEPDGQGDGEPAARIKVGAMLTRRLSATEATETPSGAAYGNPLRGRPEQAPSVPIGSAVLARTDAADARGWRVYRVTPAGTVIYDEWIDHDPAKGELAVTRLRAAARRSPEAALRHVLAGHGDHAAAREVAEWLANECHPRGTSIWRRRCSAFATPSSVSRGSCLWPPTSRLDSRTVGTPSRTSSASGHRASRSSRLRLASRTRSRPCVNAFHAVLAAAEIPRWQGKRSLRLHDLRHSFAVLRLTLWYRQQASLGNLLPALATYLGHVGIASTQRYLQLTEDVVADLTRRYATRFGHLLSDGGSR